MNSYDWVEKIRDQEGGISDYKIGQMIGLTRASMSQHKRGRCKHFDDDVAFNVAKVLSLDPVQFLAENRAGKAKNKETKALWMKIASSAACVLLAVGISDKSSAKSMEWWPGTESNCRHGDFQSLALASWHLPARMMTTSNLHCE